MAGINGHEDDFWINDIQLTIPPDAIKISKQSINNSHETLRTRSSQKVKTGQAEIQVSFSVPFIGEEQINKRLRPIIAQLRLTPFCYVENSFLRTVLAPGTSSSDRNMALTLRGVVIDSTPELPTTLFAHFDFLWFNYLPYSNNFHFRKDILINENDGQFIVNTPEQSRAWRRFYYPRLLEAKPVDKLGLNDKMTWTYYDYAIAPLDDTLQKAAERVDVQDQLLDALDTEPGGVVDNLI